MALRLEFPILKHHLVVSLLTGVFFIFLIAIAGATPEGPTVNTVSNTTRGTSAAALVNYTGNGTGNAGGILFTIRLTSTQQNTRWKAFVGNVTGTLTLDDSSGNSLFQWTLASTSTTGEVYATRKPTTVTWSNINCTFYAANASNSSEFFPNNRTVEESESSAFVLTSNDNLTVTFSNRNHTQLTVGSRVITANTCWAMQPWKNDAAVPDNATANFSQTILYDGTNSTNGFVVYAQNLQSPHSQGFDGNLYNFQMLVPENGSLGFAGSTAYYFYIEIT